MRSPPPFTLTEPGHISLRVLGPGLECSNDNGKKKLFPLTILEEHSLMRPNFTAEDFFKAKVRALICKHPDIPFTRMEDVEEAILKVYTFSNEGKSIVELVADAALAIGLERFQNAKTEPPPSPRF